MKREVRLHRLISWNTPALAAICLMGLISLFYPALPTHATATQSTLTMQIVPGTLTTSITPTPDGVFGKTASSTISVSTDNFTGYTLSIKSQGSTSLLNNDNDAIESISSAISEATFSSSSTYNNKWGYQPSQYVTSSGGVNTTVPNTDYLPAPSTTGDLLAVTTSANSTAHQYTLVAGARVDTTLPADTYEYTYVLMATANSIVYNITYDDETIETVTNMPSPNPQALEIDGGTPAAQSYGTLSVAVPTMTSDDMSFGGWCTVHTTLNSVTHNYECIGGTAYQPGDSYPIDQTADGTNITLYAIWIEDFFPMVWSQMGKCVFTSTQTGSNPATYDGDVSGSECAEYAGDDYIDTGIALYSNDNYQKDYEVHFTVDTYNPNAQLEVQATMFNDKLSTSTTTAPYNGKSPGIIVRHDSSSWLQIRSSYGRTTANQEEVLEKRTPAATAYNGMDIRIFRINGVIYTSLDNGPLVELQDISAFDQQFGLTAWFGAYPDNVNCSESCTAAKRFFTGELSNMYIKLGDFDESNLHELTFKNNDGTTDATTLLVMDGNAIGTLPTVTRTGWLFDGWWTAASGGTQISDQTVPSADTDYYAHWYKSVADAQITNTSMALAVNDTETINITNAADIEPYTLVSSDPTVATVSSAGVVTAVSNGVATITMTGTKTGDTRAISVTVGTVISVSFDSQGGTPATYTESVADGGSFSSLPEPTRTGYTFEGWYTGTDGTGTLLTTSTVFDSNTPTQYYANWEEVAYVCKIATVQHSEQCSRSSGGCYAANWKSPNSTLIEYGYLITDSSTVTAGAAYDCDVDYDGTWDPDTERFYYFGTENGNAKLIYFKNMSNNASVAYDSAVALLPNYELDANNPSVPVWDNPNLVRHTSGEYDGKAARLMTYAEVTDGLYSGGNNHITPSDSVSTYLFEQSNFTVTNRTDGIWLEHETDGQGNVTYVSRIQTSSRVLLHGAVGSTSANASRPTIDVPTQFIEPYTAPAVTYDITFNPHNESSSWTETIDAGDDLTDVYPATDPTYAHHLFQGWFTVADSGGTQISSSTQPSGDTTYHAQWLGDVTLATFSSNSYSVQEGSTTTITVTNASSIESYGFASLDSTIATVDPMTGVVTGVAEGSTYIRVTGATSLLFVDIPITVTESIATVCKLAVTGSLHTATRASDSTPLTYGQIASSTTRQPGDAYDCDVDYDGTYSAVNERFYYLGLDSNNNAVLVAWNSYNGTAWAPGTGSDTTYSYADASAALPGNGSEEWDHPGLVEQATGKAARFVNETEVASACGVTVTTGGNLVACDYLMEHSAYDGGGRSGYWLNYDGNSYRRIHTGDSNRNVTSGGTANMARPAIVVPTSLLEEYVPKVLISFDSHGGSAVADREILPGEQVGALPAAPTYADHLFQGWFTAASGGAQIDGTETPTVNTTYHAQWKGTVAVANITNTSISLEQNTTVTINVTNSAEIEAYTFSSNDTTVATVDSSTGVVTGVADGTTTITMTGTTSGATRTINVTVAELLPVTQAVIANSDLTLAVGDEITIVVSNAALLEPYTFSSQDATIASVDAYTGVITGEGEGITNIVMTGTLSGLTKTLEVDVTGAPVTKYTVTFNANGGTTPSPAASVQVDDGDAVGSLPTTTRTNYRFFGWYKDDGTFYEEVYPEEVIDDDVTFYARWVEDTSSFPIAWAEINACTFNKSSHITGTYCLEDAVSGNSIDQTKNYIDTGISLFTNANKDKDFEAGFTIVTYNPSASGQENNATFMASKAENVTNSPGFVVRRTGSGSTNIHYTERYSFDGSPQAQSTMAAASVHRFTIRRISGVMYYAWNNDTFTQKRDISANTTEFSAPVWFGATVTGSNDVITGSQRWLIGTLTDMYVRLGVDTDYTINFDANGGSFVNSSDSSRTITINDPLGTLPVPNPPTSNHTFVGWFDESTSPATQVSASTVPTSNKTYVAHYNYNSSNTPVEFDVSNNATRGYQTLINSWVGSPVNITTFNEASPINNSTWGDTTELSELQFWTGIRNNFVNNECLIPSYGDATKPLQALSAWTSGSVDCSKPDAYNTGIGEALNVYLDNAQGALVAYAKADNGVIHNMIPGQTYYWEQQSDSTVYGYVTAVSNGSSTGTRWVDTGTIRNVRDLGGLPVTYTDSNNQTVTGTLAYGRLFRGEKLNNAAATELTNLGITTEYNVGDEYSTDTHLSDYHLNQVIHYNFDYNSGDENNASSNYMKAWTAVTNIMTDITNTSTTKNVFFHCRVGADRTGTVAYLLEGLLGVPDEERYQEYGLTNLSGLYDRTRYYKEKSSTNNLKFVYMMGYVLTTQDIYDWYMSNPNADANLIQAFRAAMTVTSNQQQQNNNSPAQQQQQATPFNLNGTLNYNNNSGSENSSESSDGGDETEGTEASGGTSASSNTDSFSAPLGVSESSDNTESPSAAGLAIAVAAAAASGVAVTAAAVKQHSNNG